MRNKVLSGNTRLWKKKILENVLLQKNKTKQLMLQRTTACDFHFAIFPVGIY